MMFVLMHGAVALMSLDNQQPSLTIREIVIGQGPVAQTGLVATVHFEVHDKSGKELANTRKRGLAFSFGVGASDTAPFWSFGVVGMKTGGVRRLDVKPASAYGPVGVPPVVGPGSELSVTLELVELRTLKPAPPVK